MMAAKRPRGASADPHCGNLRAMDNKSPLEDLYVKHRASLERHVRGTLDTGDDADDVVQDTFLRMLSNEGAGKRLRDADSPVAYLFRSARNLAVDRLRQLRARGSHHNIVYLAAEAEWDSPGPETTLLSRERLQALQAAVRRLPSRRRQVFYLHKVRQLTYREVAEHLGISVSMVEKHMMKALRQLDRELGGKS